jgi:DNA replication ATP-dependent helicase Dna2
MLLRISPLWKPCLHSTIQKGWWGRLVMEPTSKIHAGLSFFYHHIDSLVCLSIVFRRKRFDYCIVDEASQITLPVCVGPLQYADRFVLVGDQYQLPPIVKSQSSKKCSPELTLSLSLYVRSRIKEPVMQASRCPFLPRLPGTTPRRSLTWNISTE